MKMKIVITGGSSGIGLSIAKIYAQRSAHLILVASNQKRLDEAAESCRQLGATVNTVAADLSIPAGVPEVARQAVELLGGSIDYLFLNAGVGAHASIIQVARRMPPASRTDHLTTLLDINAVSQASFFLAAIPALAAANPPGRVILTSSISGLVGLPMRAEYCASKHAAEGFFEAARTDIEGGFAPAAAGITITIAAPPTVSGTRLRKRGVGAADGAAGDGGGGASDVSNVGDIESDKVGSIIAAAADARAERVYFTLSSRAAVVGSRVVPKVVRKGVVRKAWKEGGVDIAKL